MKNVYQSARMRLLSLKKFQQKRRYKEKVIEEWRVMNTELNRLKEEADVSARQMEEKYENCGKFSV